MAAIARVLVSMVLCLQSLVGREKRGMSLSNSAKGSVNLTFLQHGVMVEGTRAPIVYAISPHCQYRVLWSCIWLAIDVKSSFARWVLSYHRARLMPLPCWH